MEDISINSEEQLPAEEPKESLWLRIPARFFSTVFHPFLAPTYSVLMLFRYHYVRFSNLESKAKGVTLIMIFACTFVYPALSIVIMNRLGLINSVNLRNKKDRILPYVAGLTFNIWLTYMVLRPGNNPILPIDKLLMHMIVASTLAVICAFFGNIFLKVSLHMLGMGGIVGFIMFTAPYADISMQSLFIFSLLVAGAVGSSRLILKAHEPVEVYTGFFIGLMSQFISYRILFFLSFFN